MIVLTLRPGIRPGRFDALADGEAIVSGSRDPEHAAARALVARGITGQMVTRWLGSAHLSTRPRDIEAVARHFISEEGTNGLRHRKWRGEPGGEAKGGKKQSAAQREAPMPNGRW